MATNSELIDKLRQNVANQRKVQEAAKGVGRIDQPTPALEAADSVEEEAAT